MAVHGTISTTNITLFNIPINILKCTWIVTLGESVAVLKTISTNHTTITLFNIIINILKYNWIFILGECLAVLKNHIHYSHQHFWNHNTVDRECGCSDKNNHNSCHPSLNHHQQTMDNNNNNLHACSQLLIIYFSLVLLFF